MGITYEELKKLRGNSIVLERQENIQIEETANNFIRRKTVLIRERFPRQESKKRFNQEHSRKVKETKQADVERAKEPFNKSEKITRVPLNPFIFERGEQNKFEQKLEVTNECLIQLQEVIQHGIKDLKQEQNLLKMSLNSQPIKKKKTKNIGVQSQTKTWHEILKANETKERKEEEITVEKYSQQHQCVCTSPRYTTNEEVALRPKMRTIGSQMVTPKGCADTGAVGDHSSLTNIHIKVGLDKNINAKGIQELLINHIDPGASIAIPKEHVLNCCYSNTGTVTQVPYNNHARCQHFNMIQECNNRCVCNQRTCQESGVNPQSEYHYCRDVLYYDNGHQQNTTQMNCMCGHRRNCNNNRTTNENFGRQCTDLNTQHFYSRPANRSPSTKPRSTSKSKGDDIPIKKTEAAIREKKNKEIKAKETSEEYGLRKIKEIKELKEKLKENAKIRQRSKSRERKDKSISKASEGDQLKKFLIEQIQKIQNDRYTYESDKRIDTSIRKSKQHTDESSITPTTLKSGSNDKICHNNLRKKRLSSHKCVPPKFSLDSTECYEDNTEQESQHTVETRKMLKKIKISQYNRIKPRNRSVEKIRRSKEKTKGILKEAEEKVKRFNEYLNKFLQEDADDPEEQTQTSKAHSQTLKEQPQSSPDKIQTLRYQPETTRDQLQTSKTQSQISREQTSRVQQQISRQQPQTSREQPQFSQSKALTYIVDQPQNLRYQLQTSNDQLPRSREQRNTGVLEFDDSYVEQRYEYGPAGEAGWDDYDRRNYDGETQTAIASHEKSQWDPELKTDFRDDFRVARDAKDRSYGSVRQRIHTTQDARFYDRSIDNIARTRYNGERNVGYGRQNEYSREYKHAYDGSKYGPEIRELADEIRPGYESRKQSGYQTEDVQDNESFKYDSAKVKCERDRSIEYGRDKQYSSEDDTVYETSKETKYKEYFEGKDLRDRDYDPTINGSRGVVKRRPTGRDEEISRYIIKAEGDQLFERYNFDSAGLPKVKDDENLDLRQTQCESVERDNDTVRITELMHGDQRNARKNSEKDYDHIRSSLRDYEAARHHRDYDETKDLHERNEKYIWDEEHPNSQRNYSDIKYMQNQQDSLYPNEDDNQYEKPSHSRRSARKLNNKDIIYRNEYDQTKLSAKYEDVPAVRPPEPLSQHYNRLEPEERCQRATDGTQLYQRTSFEYAQQHEQLRKNEDKKNSKQNISRIRYKLESQLESGEPKTKSNISYDDFKQAMDHHLRFQSDKFSHNSQIGKTQINDQESSRTFTKTDDLSKADQREEVALNEEGTIVHTLNNSSSFATSQAVDSKSKEKLNTQVPDGTAVTHISQEITSNATFVPPQIPLATEEVLKNFLDSYQQSCLGEVCLNSFSTVTCNMNNKQSSCTITVTTKSTCTSPRRPAKDKSTATLDNKISTQTQYTDLQSTSNGSVPEMEQAIKLKELTQTETQYSAFTTKSDTLNDTQSLTEMAETTNIQNSSEFNKAQNKEKLPQETTENHQAKNPSSTDEQQEDEQVAVLPIANVLNAETLALPSNNNSRYETEQEHQFYQSEREQQQPIANFSNTEIHNEQDHYLYQNQAEHQYWETAKNNERYSECEENMASLPSPGGHSEYKENMASLPSPNGYVNTQPSQFMVGDPPSQVTDQSQYYNSNELMDTKLCSTTNKNEYDCVTECPETNLIYMPLPRSSRVSQKSGNSTFNNRTSSRSIPELFCESATLPIKAILKPCHIKDITSTAPCEFESHTTISAKNLDKKALVSTQSRSALMYTLSKDKISEPSDENLNTVITNEEFIRYLRKQSKGIRCETTEKQPICEDINASNYQLQQPCTSKNARRTISKPVQRCLDQNIPPFEHCPCMFDTYLKMRAICYSAKDKWSFIQKFAES